MTFSTCNEWHRLSRLVLSLSILLLTACGLTGPFPGVPDFVSASSLPVYTGPVAAPQVAYRIDENRYFEIVPNRAAACSDASIYYRDDARGIRSFVMPLRNLGGVDLVIDAENDQYLVAPVDKGSGNCSSGGEACLGTTLPYSRDYGKTWERAHPRSSGYDVYLSGYDLIVSSGGWGEEKTKIIGTPSDINSWISFNSDVDPLPHIRKSPFDNKFHCVDDSRKKYE